MKYVRSLSEISWNRNSLFDLRVSFENTMSIKVRLIKNFLITGAVLARLTTREHGFFFSGSVTKKLGGSGGMLSQNI